MTREGPAFVIRSARLGLRRWREEDRWPFAELNADPEVMRYFPRRLTADESDQFVERIEAHFERHGYGLYAVEELASGAFIGFIGFQWAELEPPLSPCVEIGWRLAAPFWGKGYATEGAAACLSHGFRGIGLPEVCSFTAELNERSVRVMRRIGLKHRGAFLHPRLPPDHELAPHLLYGLSRTEFDALR